MIRIDGDTVHCHGGQKPALEYQENSAIINRSAVIRVDGDTVQCQGLCLHGGQKPALKYQENTAIINRLAGVQG